METNFTEPFWEKTYSDDSVSTFTKGPTSDVAEFYENFKSNSLMLDVGCGEGRNSIYLAGRGHRIEAFDISHSGIKKAIKIASNAGVTIDFYQKDLAEFVFNQKYDVILSSGVLHLPEKRIRDKFISQAKENTVSGGFNVIGIFTDKLPATPDNAPFTKSLFTVGEISEIYKTWGILRHKEGTFRDQHPGNISHEHSFETIIAQKP